VWHLRPIDSLTATPLRGTDSEFETPFFSPDGLSPLWLDSGHLVYGISDGTLRAVRFDDETRSIIGDPVAIDGIDDEPIAIVNATLGMHYAIAADGTLLYGTNSGGNNAGVVPYQPGWLINDGEFMPLHMEPCYCSRPAISPDGTSVAMTISESIERDNPGPERNILVLSLQNNSLRRLTFDSGNDFAIWSPDSTRIAYLNRARGTMIRRADGTGEIASVSADRGGLASWAPDDRLLFTRSPGPNRDIAAIEARPGADPVRCSHPGSWSKSLSSRRTAAGLPTRPTPRCSCGRIRTLTAVSGGSARWPPNLGFPGPGLRTARLYFTNGTRLMVTDIATEPAFSFSTPRQIHDLR
jgi:hypothetical protein